ncbi:hypothetical protein DL96DRAFT_1708460 [Flagelloscypha sp. PMI_526]|nr:hypothetical protein DL96DRAFT_1708460 [Flagelloscypha sp. PMI_526]
MALGVEQRCFLVLVCLAILVLVTRLVIARRAQIRQEANRQAQPLPPSWDDGIIETFLCFVSNRRAEGTFDFENPLAAVKTGRDVDIAVVITMPAARGLHCEFGLRRTEIRSRGEQEKQK